MNLKHFLILSVVLIFLCPASSWAKRHATPTETPTDDSDDTEDIATATPTSTPTETPTATPGASSSRKLYTFDTLWGSTGSADNQLNDPEDIDISPSGKMVIADTGNNRVVIWDTDGQTLLNVGTFGTRADWRNPPQFNHPAGVFIDPTKKLYVADTLNNRIVVLDEHGMVLSTWGSQGNANGQFNLPRTITKDRYGDIWVLDTGNSRVQIFSALGSFNSTFGSFGTDVFLLNNPLGMVVNNIDQTIIADTGNFRFQVYNPGGIGVTLQGWFGDGPYQFKEPGGVILNNEGWVAIPDGLNGDVNFYNNRNGLFEFIGRWKAKDEILTPNYNPHYRGIACDAEDRIYLTDIQNNCIVRLKPVNTPSIKFDLNPTPTPLPVNPYGGSGYPIR